MYLYSGEQLNESDSEQEYFACAEIYISNTAAATLRKLKKQGESDARPKEKSNWLGLGGKGHTASGHWRQAICKLTKISKVNRCLLNIYIDDSTLFQTIFIHLLRQTDIRPADNSLFFRKDCIVIFSTEQQRWMAGSNAEPVYLQFPKTELCSLWISLLRSYAVPEIYGRWFNRPLTDEIGQGGSYRMWREVRLTVASGRNLGISKLYDPSQNPDDMEVELKDIDVYCEVIFNDAICARTTVKKGLGLPEWHESFTFSDLPPFESLEIKILREKKVVKSHILGKVIVDLITFRRGEVVEGWYPVQSINLSSQLQLGELRLKVQVFEEIILPHSAYSSVQRVLETQNYLHWMQVLENTLNIKTLPLNLTNIAISRETIVQQIQEAATWEVEKAIPSHQTIFRGNTVFTKIMERCLSFYGGQFLEASIGHSIRKLIAEKIAIEVDPGRSGKSAKDIAKNVDLLIYWCREFWEQIFAARDNCPKEVCASLSTVRDLVEEHSRKADLAPEMQHQRPWQSVSAFIFLRFLVPSILHPHLFGLCSGLPDPTIQRSLKLIAKVIQSLANLNTNDHKEMVMAPFREFNKLNHPRMMEYLKAVSTAKAGIYSNPKLDNLEGRHVLVNLTRHKENLHVLERESVPEPPHYIDPSRELAIITSAIVRHSRDPNSKTRARKLDNDSLERLCAACFEVETEALHRVNELATRLAQERRRASASAAWTRHSASLTKSPFLSSIHPSRSPLPVTSHTQSATEPRPQLPSEPDQGPDPLQAASLGHISRERHGTIEADIEEDSVAKQIQQDVLPEAPDDVARRKRSFMRGILGL